MSIQLSSAFDGCSWCQSLRPVDVASMKTCTSCAGPRETPQLLLQCATVSGPQRFITASFAVYCPLRSLAVHHSFFCSVLPSEVLSGSSQLLLQCVALRGPQWFITAPSAVCCPLAMFGRAVERREEFYKNYYYRKT